VEPDALVSVARFSVRRAQLSRDGLYLHGQGVDDGWLLLDTVTHRAGPHVGRIQTIRVAVTGE
jgi:hypothetical protein